MELGNLTQALRFGGEHLCLLSYLPSPLIVSSWSWSEDYPTPSGLTGKYTGHLSSYIAIGRSLTRLKPRCVKVVIFFVDSKNCFSHSIWLPWAWAFLDPYLLHLQKELVQSLLSPILFFILLPSSTLWRTTVFIVPALLTWANLIVSLAGYKWSSLCHVT